MAQHSWLCFTLSLSGAEFTIEAVKMPLLNSRPDIPHQLEIEMQVVNGVQARTQHLTAGVQVAQVGPAVVLAGITLAAGLQWPGVFPMP
jgi:hypothetical protein